MSSQLPNRHATSLVEITRRDGVLLVKPTGPSIGQREAPIIQEEVMPYLDEMGKDLDHLVVDLSSVTFMSSMGLGMCISFRNKASACKSDSILFGVCKELLGLLSMMKIEKLYKIAKDQAHLDKLLK
ncbi:MAG: STAS domain-containing protein [Phycisphaerales bacterium]|jgi:anti-anti-sigma factor|nr:STAS domain-containing protein [Phycisphaerales bacterium]